MKPYSRSQNHEQASAVRDRERPGPYIEVFAMVVAVCLTSGVSSRSATPIVGTRQLPWRSNRSGTEPTYTLLHPCCPPNVNCMPVD